VVDLNLTQYLSTEAIGHQQPGREQLYFAISANYRSKVVHYLLQDNQNVSTLLASYVSPVEPAWNLLISIQSPAQNVASVSTASNAVPEEKIFQMWKGRLWLKMETRGCACTVILIGTRISHLDASTARHLSMGSI